MIINVAIVEDDEGIRETFSNMISGARGFKCAGSYPNPEMALQQIPSHKPDVILMDINMPGMSGIECVSRLKTILPEIPVIMLTVYDDEEKLFQSLSAGASGYLLKRTPPSKLLSAIKDVYFGGAPMSGQIARMVVEHFHRRKVLSNLTVRELKILESLAQGYRYKEIADELSISYDTVRSHLRAIYEKLHVSSRTEAVVKYLQEKNPGEP